MYIGQPSDHRLFIWSSAFILQELKIKEEEMSKYIWLIGAINPLKIGIVGIEPAGKLVDIKFLEQCSNQPFKYSSGSKIVERKWNFYQDAKRALQGRVPCN